MEAADSVLVPGYRLDRYELLCPIASGGMATVWLARLRGKRGFEKLFAIKTIKTELVDDARFQEMFLDEARIASGIEHPNVAHILDLGEQGHVLYIVMEWVDGESLGKIAKLSRRRKTPVPLPVALRVVADAAAGLHAAHELRDAKGEPLGVVHRDVSPQNILVTSAGTVKVIDFGVAKAKNRVAGETGEGVVKGKIRYMAPEQVSNKNVDRRADVWALGVCLHELVTGRVPFESDTDIDVLKRLMGDEPTPIDRDAIPAAVVSVLEGALARDPEERFGTAAAMRRAIEATITELGVEATTDTVAEFVQSTLPELEAKRRDVVATAIEEARSAAASSASMPAEEDVAFAPTMVGPSSSSSAGAPKRRGPALTAKQLLEGGAEESKVTRTSFTDEERAALPSNRGWYALIAGVALVAGAWFVWPGGARIRGFVAPASTPAATAAPDSAEPTPLVPAVVPLTSTASPPPTTPNTPSNAPAPPFGTPAIAADASADARTAASASASAEPVPSAAPSAASSAPEDPY